VSLCPLGVFSVVFLSFPFFVLFLLYVPVDVTTGGSQFLNLQMCEGVQQPEFCFTCNHAADRVHRDECMAGDCSSRGLKGNHDTCVPTIVAKEIMAEARNVRGNCCHCPRLV
jgi:hypothetical protein